MNAKKKQRESRKLVADDENDKRFKEERFLTSPAVFPTNDSKYDVNKKRSLHFAASQDTGIMYCIAQDKPSVQALRERPDIPDLIFLIGTIVKAVIYMACFP